MRSIVIGAAVTVGAAVGAAAALIGLAAALLGMAGREAYPHQEIM